MSLVATVYSLSGIANYGIPNLGIEFLNSRIRQFQNSVSGFPAHNLRDRPPGILLNAFKVMKDMPVFEPVYQLPGLEQEIRIARFSKLRLIHGVSVVNKKTPRS